jgi:hypothetical protein
MGTNFVCGGGGGGAGLGGAVFAYSGSNTVLSCLFTGNLATNGLNGATPYNSQSAQGVAGALFSATTNLLVQDTTFTNNVASSYAPDVVWPFLVFSLADSGPGSLRQVLASATNGVTVDFNVTGTITLTSGPLNVTTNVTLLGPGLGLLTVSGNNSSGVFNVTGTNVAITGLTIANGYSGSGTVGAGITAAGRSGSRFTLYNCAVTANTNAGYNGGGIFINTNVTVLVTNCTFSGNSATYYYGGGIYNLQGMLSIVGSTLKANVASRGGAICNDGGSSSATLTMANSTLSGNSADALGGGIFNDGSSSPVTNKINSSTFSGNSASQGGAIDNYGPAGRVYLEIGDTILNVGAGSGGTIYNPSGIVKSDGYNLSSDAAGGDGTTAPGGLLNGTNDIRNTNPLLGPLQDNGGLTWTHALLPGSPAIDKGNADAITNLVMATDQRGQLRTVDLFSVPNPAGGDGSDIGAFELQTTTSVANANDSGPGSLRAVLLDATNGSTITFSAPLSGATISLTSGQIVFYRAATVDASALANGIKVDGNHASRVFQVGIGVTVVLNSLTITNGIDTGDGNEGGAGILNYGTLTLNNCTVAGNSAASTRWGGGGILTYNGALTLNQCTVSGNSARVGAGGIQSGSPTVVSCTFSGNSGPSVGGISGSGTIRNTIVKAGASGANFGSTMTSGGYNLSSDGSGAGFLTAVGDQNNTDPKLGPLQDNGGPTPTHALLPGSPAIDQGKSFGFTTDQRGLLRPVDFPSIPNATGGDGSDIGAFEGQLVVTGPRLFVGLIGNAVTVYWQNVAGFNLQTNNDLTVPVGWSVASGWTTSNGTNYLNITPPSGNLFFRLAQP